MSKSKRRGPSIRTTYYTHPLPPIGAALHIYGAIYVVTGYAGGDHITYRSMFANSTIDTREVMIEGRTRIGI